VGSYRIVVIEEKASLGVEDAANECMKIRQFSRRQTSGAEQLNDTLLQPDPNRITNTLFVTFDVVQPTQKSNNPPLLIVSNALFLIASFEKPFDCGESTVRTFAHNRKNRSARLLRLNQKRSESS
jgi:hypothetical protein